MVAAISLNDICYLYRNSYHQFILSAFNFIPRNLKFTIKNRDSFLNDWYKDSDEFSKLKIFDIELNYFDSQSHI